MSDKEKDLIKKIAQGLPSLGLQEQNYILGVVDGIALAKQSNESEKKMAASEQPVE